MFPFYQSVGVAPGLEESELSIGCPQMEMHHNLYSSNEEGRYQQCSLIKHFAYFILVQYPFLVAHDLI